MPEARIAIVGGHVRPSPVIEKHEDEHGRIVVDRETHFAPAEVHFAIDPNTGLVYAGTSPDHAQRVGRESEFDEEKEGE